MIISRIRNFEDLDVWQISRDLVLTVYEITLHFPQQEIYGLASQLKRTALSIPANIAEGFGRFHFMDKAKFYLNARGSLYELKSHLLISKDLGFIEDKTVNNIFQTITELSIKLNNLINKTRSLNESP